MDRIIVGDLQEPRYVFNKDLLRSVVTRVHSALTGDEVRVDEFDFTSLHFEVSVYATSEGEPYVTSDGNLYYLTVLAFDIPYGEVVRYYQDDVLKGKFYVASVKRVSEQDYRVEAVSALGMMDRQIHYGNVYNQANFSDVVDEIIDGAFPWTCDPAVASIKISNWLPYATKRENLHQLLFACGVLLRKDAQGDLYFTAPYDFSTTQITEASTFRGGTVGNVVPATTVELTEHAYKQLSTDIEETLFDNTDGAQQANRALVTFKNAPVHSLRVEGQLTLVSSGVNYALVSGVGVLYGKPYTHITRVLSTDTGITAQEAKVVSIDDAYLVNITNSMNALNRMKSYYGSAQTIKVDIIHNNEKPGDRIRLPHPFGGEAEAFIQSITLKSGSFTRAACELLVGYDPGSAGNNYEECATYLEDGQFIVPEGVTRILATMIGGGQGGYSGGRGEAGTRGSLSGGDTSGTAGAYSYGDGGAGGAIGPGGVGGNVLSVEIDVEPGQVFDIRIGAGGVGGVCSGATPTAGALGEPTTFGEYSSEQGVPTVHGFSEIFSGQIVATPGMDGAAPGGNGAGAKAAQTTLTVFGRIFYSGAQGAYASDSGSGWSGEAYGGLGGGPAYGANGGTGGGGRVSDNNGEGFVDGANGGTGASATYAGEDATTPGAGGQGGSGGGGGGGAGACRHSYTAGMWPGNGGSGGNGSAGGRGASGVCYVYY